MIIEDDADLREILKFSLERAGYKTYEAESAENGLEMMNDRIRLILLDVMLPGMSGYELAGVLREKGCKIPIIFLTARSSEEDLLSGFASGGDDYVAKPFSTAELLARIGAVRHASHHELAEGIGNRHGRHGEAHLTGVKDAVVDHIGSRKRKILADKIICGISQERSEEDLEPHSLILFIYFFSRDLRLRLGRIKKTSHLVSV